MRPSRTLLETHVFEMENLEVYKEEIRDIIHNHCYTQFQAVDYMINKYGYMKGFSESSMRKFCKLNDIRACHKSAVVTDDILTEAVEQAIEQVSYVIFQLSKLNTLINWTEWSFYSPSKYE